MNRDRTKWLLPILMLYLTGLPVNAQQEGGRLQHNPFRRPESVLKPTPAQKAVTKQEQQEKPPAFVLSATLVSDQRPLVDVEGEIIGIGEEFEGYRLLVVKEGAAVFSRGDRQYTLNIGVKDLEQIND